jgi:hypothetical protein
MMRYWDACGAGNQKFYRQVLKKLESKKVKNRIKGDSNIELDLIFDQKHVSTHCCDGRDGKSGWFSHQTLAPTPRRI